jgi:hypothetical protein
MSRLQYEEPECAGFVGSREPHPALVEARQGLRALFEEALGKDFVELTRDPAIIRLAARATPSVLADDAKRADLVAKIQSARSGSFPLELARNRAFAVAQVRVPNNFVARGFLAAKPKPQSCKTSRVVIGYGEPQAQTLKASNQKGALANSLEFAI